MVYYDAFESPDAMKGDEEPASPPSPLRDEELCVLQQRARLLEARRGRITSKKVYLKNKKVKTPLTRRGGMRRVSYGTFEVLSET